jgi:hypothetical protein
MASALGCLGRYDGAMDSALIERYRNQWVAIGDDGSVVAHNASFEDLDVVLSSLPPIHVVIRRIPAADEPLFVGLW